MSFKRFIAKLFGIPMPVVAVFENIDWTKSDSESWKEYLEGATGKKILASMTYHEATANQLACSRMIDDREFVAGEASGLRKQKTMLLLMAQVEEVQKTPQDVVRGEQEYDPNEKSDIEKLIADAAREPVLGE